MEHFCVSDIMCFSFRRMSSKRKSPPTKFTPDDLSNGLHPHRNPSDPLLDPAQHHPFNTPPIPEVEENAALNLHQGAFQNTNRLPQNPNRHPQNNNHPPPPPQNNRQYSFEEDDEEEEELEEEHFLDEMTSSPGASDSCSPFPSSRLVDHDDSDISDQECRPEDLANPSAYSSTTNRKQRLLQSVSEKGHPDFNISEKGHPDFNVSEKGHHQDFNVSEKGHHQDFLGVSEKGIHPGSDSDSDPGCYSGSEDPRLSSPGQSSRTNNHMETVPSSPGGSSHHSDVRPVNRRSMDDVVKKLTSKMHSSATLSEISHGHCPSEALGFQMDSGSRKYANG